MNKREKILFELSKNKRFNFSRIDDIEEALREMENIGLEAEAEELKQREEAFEIAYNELKEIAESYVYYAMDTYGSYDKLTQIHGELDGMIAGARDAAENLGVDTSKFDNYRDIWESYVNVAGEYTRYGQGTDIFRTAQNIL